jgi:hypothetical protein
MKANVVISEPGFFSQASCGFFSVFTAFVSRADGHIPQDLITLIIEYVARTFSLLMPENP